jgi:hypothetical protein
MLYEYKVRGLAGGGWITRCSNQSLEEFRRELRERFGDDLIDVRVYTE